MIVKLLQISTGKEKWITTNHAAFTYYFWSAGNGSCDCNRSVFFDGIKLPTNCLGHRNFLIVDWKTTVEQKDGVNIICDKNNYLKLNRDYDKNIVEKYYINFIKNQRYNKLKKLPLNPRF